jgi:pSer/pThr/pTyr-binding forkhead associated (FHA) protein
LLCLAFMNTKVATIDLGAKPTIMNAHGAPASDPPSKRQADDSPVSAPKDRLPTRRMAVIGRMSGMGPATAKPSHEKPVYLCVASGPRPALVPIPQGDLTIGRSRGSGFRIASLSVSRRHAILRRTGQRMEIADNWSENGTRVNGRTIRGITPIQCGDVIQLGTVKLVILKDPLARSSSTSSRRQLVVQSLMALFLILSMAAWSIDRLPCIREKPAQVLSPPEARAPVATPGEQLAAAVNSTNHASDVEPFSGLTPAPVKIEARSPERKCSIAACRLRSTRTVTQEIRSTDLDSSGSLLNRRALADRAFDE